MLINVCIVLPFLLTNCCCLLLVCHHCEVAGTVMQYFYKILCIENNMGSIILELILEIKFASCKTMLK